MQNLKFFLAFIFYASVLFAQESPVKNMISVFTDYAANHPVEKIYLHLDKPYYAAGETMYFRAYLTNMDLNQENVSSNIIYVELSDAKKNLIKRSLLYSEQLEFAGQIQISDSLPSAEYHLRAYTNWMRNAGEDYFYHRNIYIGNASKQKQVIASPQPFDYQISFFPEGGQLLAGLSNKVAFKALGNDGFGTNVSGSLTDENGKELLRFNSIHSGMGSFNFTPEKGKTYKVSVQSNGIAKEYSLPAATEGLALSARQDEQSVYLTIRSTEIKPDSIYIIGQSRNTVCYALEGMTKGHEQQIAIDKTKFPTGIAQFTLFKNGLPASERLLFIDRKDDLHVDIVPDKESYENREKATVKIQITNSIEEPVEGSFSLSVTDDKTVQPSINEQNIKGSLLLASDLKGYIESPGWYFAGDEHERAEALDNLLCTQGWSRFVWDQLNVASIINYSAESGFLITGKVTNVIGRPVKDASIILFSMENTPGTATTDENGKFGFYGFDCPEGSEFVLQCRTKRNRKTGIGFELDKLDNRQAQTNVIPLIPSENKRNRALIEDYTNQADRQIKNREGIKMIQLPEVKVEAKRTTNIQNIESNSYRLEGKALEKPIGLGNIIQASPPVVEGGGINTFGNKKTDPVFIVDDLQMSGEDFKYDYSFLPAYMFESIEILRPIDSFARYGFRASNGAFVVKTKKYLGDYVIANASIEVYRPEGYSVRKEFYVPAYDKPEVKNDPTPDLRTTIYWNPIVCTNKEGKAQVSFYTADNVGAYSYILEGIGDDKVGFIKK